MAKTSYFNFLSNSGSSVLFNSGYVVQTKFKMKKLKKLNDLLN